MKTHGKTRKFLWALDTRFVNILLLLKTFKRMMGGLCATVAHDVYKSFNFDHDFIDDRINGDEM